MSWNYTIEVQAGEDIEAAVLAKHDAHIVRYPGVSQEHALAASPKVREAAKIAGNEAKNKKGKLRIYVEGPDLAYDDSIEIDGTKQLRPVRVEVTELS